MGIQWQKYTDRVPNFDLSDIDQVEQQLGISFPLDYVDTVKNNLGKTPSPSLVKVGRGRAIAGVLYSITLLDSDYSLLVAYENCKDFVPSKIIPFMQAGGANDFAFDYRNSNTNPKVVFIFADNEGEDAIFPVADSFTEFLLLLKTREEIDSAA